jgi:hypothetical protein
LFLLILKVFLFFYLLIYTYNFNATNKPTKSNNRKVVVGPNGGKGTYTGKYDKNNNPIIQRESGSYYIKDPKTGKQQTVKSPNEHGNTLGNQRYLPYLSLYLFKT